MASYKLFFDHDVEKDLAKNPKVEVRKVMLKVMRLHENPHPPQSLKLESSDKTFRLRVGDYRTIYQIDEGPKTITVYRVRHRKDAYRSR
ncbi:MAG: type II toxin-antitoxin system mRNA interferase toxin, RelE/StbE family [Deltaproteobacteria bacterium CG11_big_fil_rev_8_21_14_0_20_49_13]|nr:MAG: type II toxin-antitoxin system mRNA interferase toxin, RelE/StbE family [Deltaproteobacteria bacterium CG11_big_fil_rev_8_21_14_0_20_49_13]